MVTTDSALPDIYVEEDLKRIQAKNKEIVILIFMKFYNSLTWDKKDDDLDVIGEGVTKLKEIALDINQVRLLQSIATQNL